MGSLIFDLNEGKLYDSRKQEEGIVNENLAMNERSRCRIRCVYSAMD